MNAKKRNAGLAVFLVMPIGLFGCSFPAWRDQVYADLMAGRLHIDPSQVSPGGSSSSYLDFYDRSGRRLGYGIVRDGRVDVYGADGSRLGHGAAR